MGKKRKTRQEKRITDLRKKLVAVQSESSQKEPTPSEKKSVPANTISLSNYSINQTQKNQPRLSFSSPIPLSYIKKDLTKTFVLAILAISLEIVLYFLLR